MPASVHPATLDECWMYIAQLQNEIQEAISQLHESNQRNHQLNDQLQALSTPQPPDSTFSKSYSGVISGTNRLEERFLRDIFNRHQNAAGVLCGPNLVQALRDADAPIIPASDHDLAHLVGEFDVNGNGSLGFREFQQATSAPDELQLWFNEKNMPLAADAFRPLVGRCSDQLKQFGLLSPVDVQHAAAAIASAIPVIIQDLHRQIQDSFAVWLPSLTHTPHIRFDLTCSPGALQHRGRNGR